MIELWIDYWRGERFVNYFRDKEAAMEYYEKNMEQYKDIEGAKFGFPYATPLFISKTDKEIQEEAEKIIREVNEGKEFNLEEYEAELKRKIEESLVE